MGPVIVGRAVLDPAVDVVDITGPCEYTKSCAQCALMGMKRVRNAEYGPEVAITRINWLHDLVLAIVAHKTGPFVGASARY
eukprot:12904820-Prorocentrum_lima.AAC.1